MTKQDVFTLSGVLGLFFGLLTLVGGLAGGGVPLIPVGVVMVIAGMVSVACGCSAD